MNYEFPKITDLKDVLPHIEGRDEFKHILKNVPDAEGTPYSVITYVVIKPDTFAWDENDPRGSAIRRECRGLMFDHAGRLISRPFHKFFNLGERDDTTIEAVEDKMAKSGVSVMTKHDGSMVRPVVFGDKLYMATKVGLTDIGMDATSIISQQKDYIDHMKELLLAGATPMFEYVGPKNKIVVQYTHNDLKFLGLRSNHSGNYDTSSASWKLTEEDRKLLYGPFGEPETVSMEHRTIQEKIDFIRSQVGMEGYVWKFEDGHMVKVKNDWYLKRHKIKDVCASDRNIVRLIIDNEIDDVYPMVDESIQERITDLKDWVWYSIDNKKATAESLFIEAKAKYGDDRGAYAREFSSTLHPIDQGILFGMWDGKNAYEPLMQAIGGHLSTETRWETLQDYLDA